MKVLADKNLENLLSEYEQKRRKAQMESEKNISQLYEKFPGLEEIDDELNKYAISKSKAILGGKNDLREYDTVIESLKNKKEQFLQEKKININLYKPKYECKMCNDTGYIQENNKSIMCNCLKQRLLNLSYNQSNLSDIKNMNFDNFNISLFSDEVDTKKYKIKCSPRQNILNIKNACIKFIDNFDNLEEKNLFFCGNTGLGKTYMSNAIANEILKRGKTVLYQTAPVLLETVIDGKFNKYKNQNSDEFYKNVLTVDLLIIDDLGTENINSMTVSELFTILNTRILNLNNKPTKTIVSTNLSIEQIFKIYEERIGSRIAGYYNIYQFIGADLRLKR